jgi:hypothetical protein
MRHPNMYPFACSLCYLATLNQTPATPARLANQQANERTVTNIHDTPQNNLKLGSC